MKMFFAIASMLVAASFAQARPSSYNMTCDDAKATVAAAANGVVMNYAYSAKAGYLYSTFFADSFSCTGYDSQSQVAWVKTADVASCFVGYTCGPRNGRH